MMIGLMVLLAFILLASVPLRRSYYRPTKPPLNPVPPSERPPQVLAPPSS